MASWRIVATDKTFTNVGEVFQQKSLKCSLPMNKLRQASFTIRLDNTMAPFLALNTEFEPVYIKLYRNAQLMFNGPVATVQETGDDKENGLLQINAVGPEFIWAFRLPVKSMLPLIKAEGTDTGTRFKELISTYNKAGGSLNDHIDSTGLYETSNRLAIEIQPFQTIADVLNMLYNQAAGFDWYITSQEAEEEDIGKLILGDVLGSPKINAVFEWGTGRYNISSFNRTSDLSQMANLVYNVSSAGPEASGAPTVHSPWTPGSPPEFVSAETWKKEAETAEALASVWGLREASANLSILNTGARQQFVDEAAKVRRLPRRTITFAPIIDDGSEKVPVFGYDYELGDSVRARIVREGNLHFDGMVRCWGIDFAVDENNKEVQTLTTSDA